MNTNVTVINGQQSYIPPPTTPRNENIFIDRRKNSNGLLIILAGYKSFLFDDVFARVKAFTPRELDICITSSGLFDETLNKIAAENNWSYLSMVQNNVPLALNMATMLHEQAQIIFKMDEDIFITDGVFDTLIKTYNHVQSRGYYTVGFVAPIIPINSFGHILLLEKLGLVETYEKMFEKLIYAVHDSRKLYSSPEVAKFFWGEGGFVPSIDAMNDAFRIQKLEYSICSVSFSIGFILFHRGLWELMGGWQLPPPNSWGPGLDEEQLCQFCALYSLGMVVSENAVVGHLSFADQNAAMKEYFLAHREKFRCPK